MIINKVSKYFQKNGLPVFWQYIVLIVFLLSIFIAFSENKSIYLIATTLALVLEVSGFTYQLVKKDRSLLLWGPLFLGVILIKLSVSLHETNIFSNSLTAFWIEQAGILLISIFAFVFMYLFEKKFQLNGVTTDFSLFVLSIAIFTLLISPHLLDDFLYKLDLPQKLIITKLIFGFTMLAMMIFLQVATKKIVLHNIVLVITILLIITHFSIDLLNSFGLTHIDPKVSIGIYYASGAFILMFSFVENILINYHEKSSYMLGSTLMWIASISAIFTIPASILIRWFQNQEPINPYIIGVSSFILSSIVIMRLVILIRNNQQQGKNLKKIAFTDSLTYLPNYHGLLEKVESKHLENTLIIAISIDDFRSINDLYGRPFGDSILISLAKRLKQLPNINTASRTGSSLFFITTQVSVNNIKQVAKSIQKRLGTWDVVEGKRVAVPLTYGASHSIKHIDPKVLIHQAEEALTIARSRHQSCSFYYENTTNQLPRHKVREILQQAIDLNDVPIYFQPIYNLKDGSLKAMELLIRIQSKEHGLLMPGQFLEQAHAYGLLTPLTKICINIIAKHYESLPKVIININLPSYMLKSSAILDEFLNCFAERNLPPKRFCIEVMEDQDIPADKLLSSLQKIKKLGFTIAMDDFGTGYSSLSRLSMLPFDTIKIDRSLLLAASTGNKTILEGAIKLIKRLNISVLVEGVETVEQLTLIRHLGADSVQGFLFSKPVDVNRAKQFHLNATSIIAKI